MIKVDVRHIYLLLVTQFARDKCTYQASLSYLNMNNITCLLLLVSILRFFIMLCNLQYLKDNV